MEQDTQQKIINLESKIDQIYMSVEKTRKYFFWTMIVTLVLFILPLILMMFALPSFMTNYVDTLNSLQ